MFSKDGTTNNVEASNAIAHMKEISSKLPEGLVDKPGPDDVFSKVIGNDRHGDADNYGLGVRASDVWGVLPSPAACRRENILLKCKIDQLKSPTVAREWLKSLDPNEQVGGKEIGREWCEVNVQVAIKRDEYLVRPYGLFITIEDAIGASIAWPCPFISVVRED